MVKKIAINPPTVWKPELVWNIAYEGKPVPPEKSAWEQGIKKGNWFFMSGQTPNAPDGTLVGKDMRTQMIQVLENMKNMMAAAGGTMNDICWFNPYFLQPNIEEGLKNFGELIPQYMDSPYASGTAMEVTRLAWRGQLLEIDAIAILD